MTINIVSQQGDQTADNIRRQTFNQAVAGSIADRGVIKAPRSTQPSIPPG